MFPINYQYVLFVCFLSLHLMTITIMFAAIVLYIHKGNAALFQILNTKLKQHPMSVTDVLVDYLGYGPK